MLKEWRKAIIIPLYRGNGSRDEGNSYRGINSLCVLGKMHRRVLNNRVMEITDQSVGNEQGGFN